MEESVTEDTRRSVTFPGGVVSEGRREHARSDEEARGARTEGAEPGERERGVSARVPPGLEVIADEDRVVPKALGQLAELEELARPELLGGRLVADAQHGRSFFS